MKPKKYTDLEQSKKLSRILPWKTADMTWVNIYTNNVLTDHVADLTPFMLYNNGIGVPCWSLAALLEEIPYQVVNKVEEGLTLHIEKEELQYYLRYENECTGDSFEIETDTYDDLIDACFEMICTLKEMDLL